MLPAICTEERITLGAELEDGTVVRGQNNISHPAVDTSGGGERPRPAAELQAPQRAPPASPSA